MRYIPKPGGAIFQPRTFAANRKKFGHSSTRLTRGPIASPQQGAAELQHAIANRIREYLLDENTDLKRYCEAAALPAGLSYERFQRSHRGETMLTITDLMYWAARIPGFADFAAETMGALADESHTSGSDLES